MKALSAREWGVLFVLCGAIFLEGIDIAMLNVALPSIRSDLGLATGQLQWVVSAYVLGYGGFMLVGGRAADLFGRRRVFVAGLTVFLLFSGLGGLATEGWMLIVARFVTGVAAAFMTPAGLSLVTTSFEAGPQRDRALLVYSGTAAGGFSVGLVVGGLLTSAGWRWVFFAPVLLSFLILVAALVLLPKAPDPAPAPVPDPSAAPSEESGRSRQRIDLPGGIAITVALVLLILGVERASHTGIGWTLGTFAAGLTALGVFVAVERRTSRPLVRLGILRNGPLVRANLTALLVFAAFFGFQFLVVLYMQELREWSVVETSFAMLVMGIDAVLAPTLTPRLVSRFGNARVILGGMVLAVLGYALFLPVGADWTYAVMLPGLLLLGLSFALAYGPLTIVGTEGVEESEQGLAGGLLYTSFQFGAALGLSTATTVNVAATNGTSDAALLDGFRAALVVPLVAAVVAAAISASGLRRGARSAAGSEVRAGAEPEGPAHAAVVDGAVADAVPSTKA